jgi:hypothetical protein
MKAWRLNAEKINSRCKAGSREATARTQKEALMAMPKLPYASTWLLDGLLLRGGYINTTLALPSEAFVPPTEGFAKRVMRVAAKAKRWFGK